MRKTRVLREAFIGDLNGDEETAPRLDVVDASPDPEADYLRREEAEVLSAAIDNLTRQLRTAIKLRELGELSTRETARHMRLLWALLKPRVPRQKETTRDTAGSWNHCTRPSTIDGSSPVEPELFYCALTAAANCESNVTKLTSREVAGCVRLEI